MRTLFDQYRSRENQLTHALVCCLSEDGRLLRDFVKWAVGSAPSGALSIVEQSMPGEEQYSEEEAERRGIPDIWIYNESNWALVIECKVQSRINDDQLRRHLNMARRRGFENIQLLVLSPGAPPTSATNCSLHRRWCEVYEWVVGRCGDSLWARKLKEYMEVADQRLTEDGILTDSLTRFAGIPFDYEHPYNYLEAKRVLRLLMQELRADKRLRVLGVSADSTGRGAITGTQAQSVWDYLPLRHLGEAAFTSLPHLTITIRQEHLFAYVTVPNGVRGGVRKRLIEIMRDGHNGLIATLCERLVQHLQSAPGAQPWVEILQRYYASQRAKPMKDAQLMFDLRTACPQDERKLERPVKPQPQWMEACAAALMSKQSNLQVAIGGIIPYGCEGLRSGETAVSLIVGIWLACEPLITALLGAESRRGDD